VQAAECERADVAGGGATPKPKSNEESRVGDESLEQVRVHLDELAYSIPNRTEPNRTVTGTPAARLR
jgi:hypothetical protein